MAALVKKVFCLTSSEAKWAVSYQFVRNHWNRDWKPSEYPVTRDERELSAKKYGLRPEEYEPYADGAGFGDYPKLPEVSGDSKDPYYPYDFPEHKRNFNEPFHVEADMYGEDRIDINLNPKNPPLYQLGCFLTVVLGSYGLFLLMESNPKVIPVLPKQYPEPGVVHYTFECK